MGAVCSKFLDDVNGGKSKIRNGLRHFPNLVM